MTEAFSDYNSYALPPGAHRTELSALPTPELTSVDHALAALVEGQSWVLDYRGCAESGQPPVRRKIGGAALSVVSG